MPFRTLKLLPGVDVEQSAYFNETRLTLSNLIRFYAGLPQKLGGWLQLCVDTFVGICRGLHGWADIFGNSYMAVGTDQRLEVLISGALFDITPIVTTTNPAVSFTTVISTSAVTILDAGDSPAVGDWINLQTQVAVGGLVLFGFYRVTVVVDATHYTVDAGANATSSVTGGAVPAYTTTNTLATVSVHLVNHGLIAGALFNAAVSTTVATVVISGVYNVTSVTDADNFIITAATPANATTTASENAGNARIEYLLSTGPSSATPLFGYGLGDYGAGDYGISPGGGGQIIVPLRQWSLGNWGQDLIASPTNGAIYYWQPPTVSPAIVVSVTAPLFNTTVFIMPQIQIIVALGAETGGSQQPLLIRWCDAGDFTDWTPTAANQAGSYVIPTGSRLVGGLATGLGALVWTDQALWSMTYQGLPFVFGFNLIAASCGLIAQRAMGIAGTLVMWIGLHTVYQYAIGGGVEPVECSVWDFYFFNFDRNQLGQIHCAVNTIWNEMAWFFPIQTSSPIYDANAPFGYIKYNYVEKVWDYGQSTQYQRSAWVGHTAVGDPTGADLAGLLQQHEQGFDANGTGMMWSWQTGFFDLAEGEEFVFVDLIIPDNTETIGNPDIQYNVLVSSTPNQTPATLGPYYSNNTTSIIPLRARGRQMAIAASGSDIGTFNRLGAVRYRYAPDGRV